MTETTPAKVKTEEAADGGQLADKDLDTVAGGTRPFMPVDGESTDDKHKV